MRLIVFLMGVAVDIEGSFDIDGEQEEPAIDAVHARLREMPHQDLLELLTVEHVEETDGDDN